MRRLAVAAVLAIATLAPEQATAAACCVSSSSGGLGRLRIWEQFAVGLGASFTPGVGFWDSDGNWIPHSETYSERELAGSVSGQIRIGERGQVQLLVPGLYSQRRGSGVSGSGGGLGDISAGFRYEVFQIGEYLRVPGFAVSSTVTAPTGRSAARSTAPLAADTTGRGAWVLALGASLEQTWLPWFLQFNVQGTMPLPQHRPDIDESQWFGPGVGFDIQGGVELIPNALVLGLGPRFKWDSALRIGGEVVENSQRLETGVGANLAWWITPHWTATTALDSGLFASGFGDNTPGRINVSASLRYGFF